MIHVKHQQTKGFTIIELMLSMTFIAMLLLAVALTTMQIGAIYNKGITLREVDQAGRSVSADLQRSIATSMPFDVTPSTSAPSTSQYIVRNNDGGRLCLGNYTYAWTLGQSITSPSLNQYTDNTAVRFARIPDQGSTLCQGTPAKISLTNARELLSSGDRDLVVHDVAVRQGASDPATGQAMYVISLVIGTSDMTQLTSDSTSCKPPKDLGGMDDYCSVNRFDIVARAGNTVK